jgi:flagellar FliL protein
VSFNPATKTSLNIDFELFGVVLAADEEEFNNLFALHEKRLNEQVTVAVRGMEASDFTDPGLGLIKRIILGSSYSEVRRGIQPDSSADLGAT